MDLAVALVVFQVLTTQAVAAEVQAVQEATVAVTLAVQAVHHTLQVLMEHQLLMHAVVQALVVVIVALLLILATVEHMQAAELQVEL
jgi:hypothetical protein